MGVSVNWAVFPPLLSAGVILFRRPAVPGAFIQFQSVGGEATAEDAEQGWSAAEPCQALLPSCAIPAIDDCMCDNTGAIACYVPPGGASLAIDDRMCDSSGAMVPYVFPGQPIGKRKKWEEVGHEDLEGRDLKQAAKKWVDKSEHVLGHMSPTTKNGSTAFIVHCDGCKACPKTTQDHRRCPQMVQDSLRKA